MVFRQQRAMAWPLFVTLLACVSTASAAMNAMTYKGCFSSSQPLSDEGSAQYQTSGLCQTNCVGRNNAVLGLSNGTNCWCGDQLPAASSLTDDSKCSTPCNGYGSDKCGAASYWSVYLTGTTNDVSNYGGSSDDSSSSSSSSSAAAAQSQTASSTSSTPSVVTSVSPGNTVVVTIAASSSASSTAAPSNGNGNGGGGSNTAGIAAGVVVGVVGAAALIGAVFFLLRRRRRHQAEADYKHSAQVSDFMRGAGERKAPNTAYSQMSDSRLDPEIGRRNSVGSMADEQDYSRRILRVANPDSH